MPLAAWVPLAAGGSTTDTVTLITGGLLALAAVVSALTPVLLARRRSRGDALADAAAKAANSGDLTLAGWTALNSALQQEITRLQGVTERMQSRIDQMSVELEVLRKLSRETGLSDA